MKHPIVFISFAVILVVGFTGCATIHRSAELTSGKLDFETKYDSVHVESYISGDVQHMRKFYFKDSKIVCETYNITVARAAYTMIRYSSEKYYYPDGKLKGKMLTRRNSIMKETDYDENGKVTKRDKNYVIRERGEF